MCPSPARICDLWSRLNINGRKMANRLVSIPLAHARARGIAMQKLVQVGSLFTVALMLSGCPGPGGSAPDVDVVPFTYFSAPRECRIRDHREVPACVEAKRDEFEVELEEFLADQQGRLQNCQLSCELGPASDVDACQAQCSFDIQNEPRPTFDEDEAYESCLADFTTIAQPQCSSCELKVYATAQCSARGSDFPTIEPLCEQVDLFESAGWQCDACVRKMVNYQTCSCGSAEWEQYCGGLEIVAPEL